MKARVCSYAELYQNTSGDSAYRRRKPINASSKSIAIFQRLGIRAVILIKQVDQLPE